MVEVVVPSNASDSPGKDRYIGRIPVRNIWLLMLYASDLYRQRALDKTAIEENPEDIPDLIAEMLTHVVERRLMRNLTFGYCAHEAVLERVRGRINLLKTERHQLLERGMIACRYDNLTVNTARNRYVRAALDDVSRIVYRQELAHRCRFLASSLKRLGVVGEKPSRGEISTSRFGRHDAQDQFMVMLAMLAFELALPTEDKGDQSLVLPEREISWLRKLFEKAVGGFYDVVISPKGWEVNTGKWIHWLIDDQTSGIDNILPSMQTDIILNNYDTERRIIIDTKFNSIVTRGRFRDETVRSGYLYQIYAYLRSQEKESDLLARNASGLLLHPSIGENVDETVKIQGHAIRFVTVDLMASAREIRNQLIRLVEFPIV